MKNKYILLFLTFCAVLVSCVSTPGNSDYYKNNAEDFKIFYLSNGIPVIYKHNASGQIATVRMIIEGGAPVLPQGKDGLEGITLNLMLHGSKDYSYEKIQKLSFDSNWGISYASSIDYSTVNARFIQKDLNEVMAVFADSILNPLLSESEYKKIMTEQKEAVQSALSDPSSFLGIELRKAAYKNHVYKTFASATEESVKSITYEDVKNWYGKILNASRLKFVVVADFSEKELDAFANNLDSKFGYIKAEDYYRPEIEAISVSEGSVAFVNDQAGESGYIAGILQAPDRYDSDYVAWAIAGMIIDDKLFEHVREKNGAVYSIGTGIIGSKDMLGIISVYKASKYEELKQYIYEAVDMFPDEKEVNERLDEYKNKYITSLFGSSQNSSGVAANIVTSIEYSGNPLKYLERSGEVQKVTAKQVCDSYAKYFARSSERALNGTPSPVYWVIVSGKETASRFKF